jgi:hypothetical protein
VSPLARAVSLLIGGALVAVGCGAGAPDLDGPAGPLTGVCPDPVVVQTDWWPQVELGALYELLGPGPHEVDADRSFVRGRLVADDVDHGVVLELRSGGPAVDFVDVPRLVHQDATILLGVVATDQQVRLGDRYPTTGVVTLLERDPLMIMWDPATYDVDRVADLPPGTEVSLFGPGLFVDHLVDAGVVQRSQLTYHHTGRPERFVDSQGAIAQQGFAADPYLYERLVEQWGRPVRFELVHSTGWQPYAGVLAGVPTVIEQRRACLELLVPLVQRAIVDFASDPEDTTQLIRVLLDRFDAGFRYSNDQALWSIDQLVGLGIVADSPAGTAGGFDPVRLERFLDRAVGLLGRGDELTGDDLATNRFIDPAVSFGGAAG